MSTVLITGASSGLGAEFARSFARQGCDVVIAARREARLVALADELQDTHGISAHVLACDLTLIEDRERLVAEHPRIDVLVNNAGFGEVGARFGDMPVERIGEMVTLNCTALAELCHRYLPTLASRRGALINVASTGAFQPLPHSSLYAATKAFVLSFTQAISTEYKGTGLTVQCLCPGPTESEFWDVAHAPEVMANRRSAAQVVESSMAGLAKGRTVVVDGTLNAIGAGAARVLPYSIVEKLVGHVMEKPQA